MYLNPNQHLRKLENQDELEDILKRNDIESSYTSVDTIRRTLIRMKINPNEEDLYSKFTLRRVPVGNMITNQPYLCNRILNLIPTHTWEEESNEFYEHGGYFNLLTLPVFLTPCLKRQYVFFGNTRANFTYHLYNKANAKIISLIINDDRAIDYAEKKFDNKFPINIIDLKINSPEDVKDQYVRSVYHLK